MQSFMLLAALFLAASASVAQSSRSGAYIVRQGEVEVSREHYKFDGSRLIDTVDLAARDLRLATEMVLGPTAAPVRYRAHVLRLSDGARIQQSEVSFRDSVVEWMVGAQERGQSSISPPYGMMQNPVFAHLAIALRRLDSTSPSSQQLNMWTPEQGSVVNLEVRYTHATAGTATLAGIAMEFQTDSSGWLEHVDIPAQNVAVQWYPDLCGIPGGGQDGIGDSVPAASRSDRPVRELR